MGKMKNKGCFRSKLMKSRQEKAKAGVEQYLRIRKAKPDHSYACTREIDDVSSNIKPIEIEEAVRSIPTMTTRENDWRIGRQVVELSVLADGLTACKMCGHPLQLHNAHSIIYYGLAAILKVPCLNQNCKEMNCIPTGKRHDRVWGANTKLASAMMHSGIGERQVNSFLSELNIHSVSKWTLLQRQKEAGSCFDSVAQESIQQALDDEMELTNKSMKSDGLTVSVDGAWQKRGSGRGFDSLTGHCTMIGAETGKVLGYSVRSKFCKLCDTAQARKLPLKVHQCSKNWEGSSKAMEQDMVIEMVSKHKSSGKKISTIIADEDTTTISRIRNSIEPEMKKKSDKNHMRKIITSKLFSLQQKHKSLSKKVIGYIQKCINYMLSQNQGNQEGIVNGLDALSRHPFGNHSLCNSSWCSHLLHADRKYHSLPYGKALTDGHLQQSLEVLFSQLKSQSDKLSQLGSTQANESLNKTVASKAPKAHFYGGTLSLKYRVVAGVAHKNIGHSYITKVNQKMGLSPGNFTYKLATFRDLQARKRKAINVTNAKMIKKRRVELKARRTQQNMLKEVREGVNYNSSIQTVELNEEAIATIPPPQQPPQSHSVEVPANVLPVFFDLETTGLARTSHSVQVAAIQGLSEWSTYIFPKQSINKCASSITGISIKGKDMLHHGKHVFPSTISSALDGLCTFLENLSSPVVLAGHNIKIFDCPILFNALKNNDKLSKFCDIVYAFMDTKILLKNKMPNLPSYSQQNIYKTVTGKDYSAHDALEDVRALQELVQSSDSDVSSCTLAFFYYKYVNSSINYSLRIQKHMSSYSDIVEKKIMSVGMARKAAGSDLSLYSLKLAYSRNGLDGLRAVLSEKCGNHVRVTKSEKIIGAISNYFSEE